MSPFREANVCSLWSIKVKGSKGETAEGWLITKPTLIRVGFVITQHGYDSSDSSLLIFFLFYPEVNDDKCRMCFHFIPCENVKCIFASEVNWFRTAAEKQFVSNHGHEKPQSGSVQSHFRLC